MRDQALQLPPADPLVSSADGLAQAIARLIPTAVGAQNVMGPLPAAPPPGSRLGG